MGTVLNNLFGKGKGNFGDVEYWHGAERAGWLMKQGMMADHHLQPSYHDTLLVLGIHYLHSKHGYICSVKSRHCTLSHHLVCSFGQVTT